MPDADILPHENPDQQLLVVYIFITRPPFSSYLSITLNSQFTPSELTFDPPA